MVPCFGNGLACKTCATTFIFEVQIPFAAAITKGLFVLIYGMSFLSWLVDALDLGPH